MLTKSQLIGPWAGLPIAWKDDNAFDEKQYRIDVANCCAADIPGVYTGGTTGEFYALEFDEFKAVTNATIRECRNGKKPVMIGCTATFTLGVIRRARYAIAKGADAIQIALPFWMELTDAEVVSFFKDVSAAVPGMPLMIYETLRAKKAISLKVHTLIHEAVPAVIGVKSNENTLGHTREGCAQISKLYNVFVGENMWYELGPSGAIGCCSSLVYQNPRIVLQVFDLLLKKQWKELKVAMDTFNHIINEGLKPCFDAGCKDSAMDRLLGLSAGFLKTSLHCRKPYVSCTQTHLIQFRKWLKDNHPEYLEL
ncbi:MAG: dihydrodipicolinate synthase family protein [Kiritimatiellae bacterium]|nr:dihydrodipicolinate synthase family protein [Kiritimatiellia bacterium]